ncbi:MAG TPA: cell wall hydrolase, partial [Caulobacteraceae bacterium]|nr:cell wall hydrolase [Caulobacteraceae bacterium]
AEAGMSSGALAVARRFDPAAPAADTSEARQAASLVAARTDGQLVRVSAPIPAGPFHMAGALDSSRDLDCLTAAVYYEARGESRAGQAAVAQVVLNRVRHPAFPKTVCGVVFQGLASGSCQFSFACDGAMRRPREPAAWRSAREVAARALSGYVMPQVGQAISFHVTALGDIWGGTMTRVSEVGGHTFYRFGGRPRALSTAVYAAEAHAADAHGADAVETGHGPVLAVATPTVALAAATAEAAAKDAAPAKAPADAKPAEPKPAAAS